MNQTEQLQLEKNPYRDIGINGLVFEFKKQEEEVDIAETTISVNKNEMPKVAEALRIKLNSDEYENDPYLLWIHKSDKYKNGYAIMCEVNKFYNLCKQCGSQETCKEKTITKNA